ncbi:MAG: molybdate ABC transporter substrate-binding protein [Spirochaetia bacterium]|jgi:molybdate transport system substrate-binding protein|nr:molybdate ABC transporter substrate-binding protein [Spirochaetia bacterium]
MKKKMCVIGMLLGLVCLTAGFAQGATEEKTELLVSCAASLTDCMNELKSTYMEKNPQVTITCNYGSSGALQQQIEQGAPADMFFSAGLKQMTALQDKKLMDDSTVKHILENNVVLIVPENGKKLKSFDDLKAASVEKVGIGDPKSVPAGQYAAQVFTNLGLDDALKGKLVLAKDVREVLSWVETGNVDAGVVYSTDAQLSKKVVVCAVAPQDSHKRIIYPVGLTKDCKAPEAAKAYEDFLFTDEAAKIFAKYGFSVL